MGEEIKIIGLHPDFYMVILEKINGELYVHVDYLKGKEFDSHLRLVKKDNQLFIDFDSFVKIIFYEKLELIKFQPKAPFEKELELLS